MRRWVAACIAVLSGLGLAACDPAPTSGTTDGVVLVTTVNADGSARATMLLDGTDRSDTQLRSWGEAVGSRLFPTTTSLDVRIDPNDGGYPFIVIDAPGVYQRGPQPEVGLDTREAVGWLLSNGAETVDVYIHSPRVPLSASWTPPRGSDGGSWEWTNIQTTTEAPFGGIVMSPQPWLGVRPVVLTILAVALLIGSLGVGLLVVLRRGRLIAMLLTAMLLTAVALIASVTAIRPDGGDNLNVAGVASGTWLRAAATLPMLSVLSALAAGVLFLVFALALAAEVSLPPSRPEPPEGSTPPHG